MEEEGFLLQGTELQAAEGPNPPNPMYFLLFSPLSRAECLLVCLAWSNLGRPNLSREVFIVFCFCLFERISLCNSDQL